MENTSKKWEGTKGKPYVKLGPIKDAVRIENKNYAVFFDNPSDANLFADALTTIQSTGLFPSELKQQRDKLLIAVQTLLFCCSVPHDQIDSNVTNKINQAKELIQKFKGHE